MNRLPKIAATLSVAALLVTPAADAGGGKPSKPTKVTIDSAPAVVFGEVKSVRKCSARRTVVLYQILDDERERVRADKANADGAYQFVVGDTAEYEVKASRKTTRRFICKPDISERVEGGL